MEKLRTVKNICGVDVIFGVLSPYILWRCSIGKESYGDHIKIDLTDGNMVEENGTIKKDIVIEMFKILEIQAEETIKSIILKTIVDDLTLCSEVRNRLEKNNNAFETTFNAIVTPQIDTNNFYKKNNNEKSKNR